MNKVDNFDSVKVEMAPNLVIIQAVVDVNVLDG